MTVIRYESPAPLPPSHPGDELEPGPVGWVARLRGAAEYANYVAQTEFVPDPLRDRPAAIAAAILFGDELGFTPMQSLAKIAYIKGKPSLYAEAQRSLVLAAGHEIWFEESTVTRAIAAGRRRGEDRVGRITFTMDDAKRAGLAGQPNYRSYPAEMLRARASAALARAMFADVIGGLPAVEEIEGLPDNGTTPSLPPADTAPDEKPKRTRKRTTTIREPVAPTPPADTQPEPATEPPSTDAQRRQIFALMRDLNISDRQERLDFSSNEIGRTIESSTALTSSEASLLIEALIARRERETVAALETELDAEHHDRQ